MSSITKEIVEYLANASCITLNEEEKSIFVEDLAKIISYIDVIQTITVDVKMKDLDPIDVEDLRGDVEEHSLSRKEFFINAPENFAGLIKVPVVIK